MSFFRENSNLDSILPMRSHESSAAAGQSESQKQRLFSQYLSRFDPTVQRQTPIGMVMSPSPTAEGHEADGTFDEMIPRVSDVMFGKTLCVEEKPGEGHIWDIWPRLPKDVRRWHKPATLPVSHVPIPAGSLILNVPTEELPEGWTMHIHPEGKPYYHREAMEPPTGLLTGTPLFDKGKPICRPLEIVTDSDPRNRITLKTLEHAHFIAQVTVAEGEFELPQRVQLFLELYPEEEPDIRPYAGYYLADLDNQTVFWAAPTTTSDLGASKVNPYTFSEQHLKLQLGGQFWWHMECYPFDTSVNVEEATARALDQLTFLQLDIATSSTSTSIWTEIQCQGYISMLKNCPSSRKTWMVARLLKYLTDWQFTNLYGHPSARLNHLFSYEKVDDLALPDTVSDTVSDVESLSRLERKKPKIKPTPRHILILRAFLRTILRVSSFILFEAAFSYNSALQNIYAHNLVNRLQLQLTIERVLNDWKDISLLSTVVWTANMAFLAIPYSIFDLKGTAPTPRYWASAQNAMVTASLASTIFSIGAIGMSLLHMRLYRTKVNPDYSLYLTNQIDFQPLAVLWALPFGFLMWSVLAFFVALLCLCMLVIDLGPRVFLLTLSAFVSSWIVLAALYFWRHEPNSVGEWWLSKKCGNWYRDIRNSIWGW